MIMILVFGVSTVEAFETKLDPSKHIYNEDGSKKHSYNPPIYVNEEKCDVGDIRKYDPNDSTFFGNNVLTDTGRYGSDRKKIEQNDDEKRSEITSGQAIVTFVETLGSENVIQQNVTSKAELKGYYPEIYANERIFYNQMKKDGTPYFKAGEPIYIEIYFKENEFNFGFSGENPTELLEVKSSYQLDREITWWRGKEFEDNSGENVAKTEADVISGEFSEDGFWDECDWAKFTVKLILSDTKVYYSDEDKSLVNDLIRRYNELKSRYELIKEDVGEDKRTVFEGFEDKLNNLKEEVNTVEYLSGHPDIPWFEFYIHDENGEGRILKKFKIVFTGLIEQSDKQTEFLKNYITTEIEKITAAMLPVENAVNDIASRAEALMNEVGSYTFSLLKSKQSYCSHDSQKLLLALIWFNEKYEDIINTARTLDTNPGGLTFENLITNIPDAEIKEEDIEEFTEKLLEWSSYILGDRRISFERTRLRASEVARILF